MAKTQRKYLVGVLICSLISTALLVVSLATENWITAEPNLVGADAKPSDVNYGLFFGSLDRADFFNSSMLYSLTSRYWWKFIW